MRLSRAGRRARPVRAIVLVVVLLPAALAFPRAQQSERPAAYLDAYVDADRQSGEWTIGNSNIRYTVGLNGDGTVSLRGLSLSSDSSPVTVGNDPDALVTIGGQLIRLGANDNDFVADAVDASTGTHFVALAIRFTSESRHLTATRHYLVFPVAAAIEMWTEIATTDGETRAVDNLNSYALTIPNGALDYVLGLEVPESEGGSFTRRTRSLAAGERFEIGSPTLSSEAVVPYFSVGDGRRRVISGLMWSGSWSATIERQESLLQLTVGLPPMTALARPGQNIEGPHAFIGVTRDQPGADIEAVTRFVRAGRAGREFPSLTTYNTWFVHGINVNESTLRRDIAIAAQMGIELVQLDAGWYPREHPANAFDFTDGLGTYEVDPSRFPSGLGALADYAHENGVKFGLWVEPERVSLDTVGRPGLADVSFLATQDGAFEPGVPNEQAKDAQLCLAEPAARAWVLEHLTRLIEQVHPDNLKWDFNRWVHCTRPDHHHPVNGGDYEHTRGLYEILAALRQRFPDLLIENCSGGGHRLDFAMARLTDTAWMDDRSAPSSHVRRNLQGLTSVLPAPYLFSYVMGSPDEPIHGNDDLSLLVRSRMPGVVGLATDMTELTERELNELNQQFTLAKSLRPLQSTAITYPLTAQRPGPGEWEVVQQLVPETGLSLLFAFNSGSTGSIVVQPRGLRSDATYELRSSDRGVIGHLRGADLIANGLEIQQVAESASQVLVLEPDGAETAASARIGRSPQKGSTASRSGVTRKIGSRSLTTQTALPAASKRRQVTAAATRPQ